MADNDYVIFSGSANLPLAKKIASGVGKNLGSVELKRFSDGEIWAKYSENIRGLEVFIVQSTNPPAENVMELLILFDAAKRASAKKITAAM